jgi:hypothetical protein
MLLPHLNQNVNGKKPPAIQRIVTIRCTEPSGQSSPTPPSQLVQQPQASFFKSRPDDRSQGFGRLRRRDSNAPRVPEPAAGWL